MTLIGIGMQRCRTVVFVVVVVVVVVADAGWTDGRSSGSSSSRL